MLAPEAACSDQSQWVFRPNRDGLGTFGVVTKGKARHVQYGGLPGGATRIGNQAMGMLHHVGINNAGILRLEMRAGFWRTRSPCSLRASAVGEHRCRDAPESLAGW